MQPGGQSFRLASVFTAGEVVLGDIGSERRMEFAVVGDTVNVASRLQEMTRRFDLTIVTSEDVISAAKAESKGLSIGEFQQLGHHELRGRQGAIHLWGAPVVRMSQET